jgi:hypothetical protein
VVVISPLEEALCHHPKQRSLEVGLKSPKTNGDYHMLKQIMEKVRKAVQTLWAALVWLQDELNEQQG